VSGYSFTPRQATQILKAINTPFYRNNLKFSREKGRQNLQNSGFGKDDFSPNRLTTKRKVRIVTPRLTF
jgi:hypothetical protein